MGYAIDAADGTKIWSYKTGDCVFSSPVLSLDGEVVYVGSEDFNLYAISTGMHALECNPAKGCNVCDACCRDFIPDGRQCRSCYEEECKVCSSHPNICTAPAQCRTACCHDYVGNCTACFEEECGLAHFQETTSPTYSLV
eukprot:NODE_6552_length_497_cov_268.271493.p3 GENE.NODE_6552_length_497_cov_268.271493~~NODE_6552_length_497_cov_268.271493.p3  ORF type:complete len:140 (+),score=25.39 NODE_6552_length_497_cov_268.271493:3-422(+)